MVLNLGSKTKNQKYCGRYVDSLLIHDKSFCRKINKVSKGWYTYSLAGSES